MAVLDSGKRRVWIAGAGISGIIAALRLLRLGHSVTIWQTPGFSYKAIESTQSASCRILEELDALDCLSECDSYIADGLCYFERSALAKRLSLKARESGVVICDSAEMPRGWDAHCDALIDATGRAATYSGSVRRYGREVADFYEIPAAEAYLGRQVISEETFWAYRMGTRCAATAAVIARHKQNLAQIAEDALFKLDVDVSTACYVGRRFCSPQWTERPLELNRISVGDAAFAYYPLAGMGVRFAITTAIAAVAVLQTRWFRPEITKVADEYYHELCEAARVSHLTNLAGASTARRVSDTEPLVFTAKEVEGGVLRGDYIVPEKTYLLSDGSRVRWLGSIDLAQLRRLSSIPISRGTLTERLRKGFSTRTDAQRLVDWCVQHRVLSPLIEVQECGYVLASRANEPSTAKPTMRWALPPSIFE
ncbi:MAG: hypothetical protein ACJ746_31350 [Bryobacteraceae bacterium]